MTELPSPSSLEAETPDIAANVCNLQIFRTLFSGSDQQRRANIEELARRVREAAVEASRTEDPAGTADLSRLYRCLARLGARCPYSDVRERLSYERRRLESYNIPKLDDRVSRFFDAIEVIKPDWSSALLHEIFTSCVGRIQSVYLMMSYNEGLLQRHFRTNQFLFQSPDGPLRLPYRHYIAIMAASRHSCEFLVRVQQEQFIACGGDIEWLIKPRSAPPKLLALQELNRELAHSPWNLKASTFRSLRQGSQPWSVSELAHALCILTTYHALCGFVFGVGILCEQDHPPDDWIQNEPEEDPAPEGCFDGEVGHKVVELLQKYKPDADWDGLDDIDPTSIDSFFARKDVSTSKRMALRDVMLAQPVIKDPSSQRYRDIPLRGENGELRSPNSRGESPSRETPPLSRLHDRNGNADDDAREPIKGRCYVPSTEAQGCPTCYLEGNLKDGSLTHYADLSWQDHASLLLEQFFPGASEPLNEEVEYCSEMTNCTVGDTAVPTTRPIRQAVHLYVHRLYGITHDDYKYSAMNNFMSLAQKIFVKKVVCFPERITKLDFDRLLAVFSECDVIHYVTIAIQGRRMASLIFGLEALTKALSG